MFGMASVPTTAEAAPPLEQADRRVPRSLAETVPTTGRRRTRSLVSLLDPVTGEFNYDRIPRLRPATTTPAALTINNPGPNRTPISAKPKYKSLHQQRPKLSVLSTKRGIADDQHEEAVITSSPPRKLRPAAAVVATIDQYSNLSLPHGAKNQLRSIDTHLTPGVTYDLRGNLKVFQAFKNEWSRRSS